MSFEYTFFPVLKWEEMFCWVFFFFGGGGGGVEGKDWEGGPFYTQQGNNVFEYAFFSVLTWEEMFWSMSVLSFEDMFWSM